MGLRDRFTAIYQAAARKIPILRDYGPWKSTLIRLIILVVWDSLCLYIMSVMVVVAGMRYPKFGQPLPDVGFDLLTHQPTLDWMPNAINWTLGAVTLTRCMFSSQGITILRRMLFIHGVLMLMRSVCVVATSYPDASDPCKGYEPPDDINPFWIQTLGNTKLLTCGDHMFSGHTVWFVLCGLAWKRYFYLVESIIFWLAAILGMISLIFTRLHYLNDILIAIFFTVIVWHMYHLYATTPQIIKKNPVIAWLEHDIQSRTRKRRRGLQQNDELVDEEDDAPNRRPRSVSPALTRHQHQ